MVGAGFLLAVALLASCAGHTPPMATEKTTTALLSLSAVAPGEREARLHRSPSLGILVDVGSEVAVLLDSMQERRRVARLDLTVQPQTPRHRLKSELNSWLAHHDVDALHIDATADQRFLVEELAAEALLTRAYLQITTSAPGSALPPARLAPTAADSAPRAAADPAVMESTRIGGSAAPAMWTYSHPPQATPMVAISLNLSSLPSVEGRWLDSTLVECSVDAEGRVAWLQRQLPDTLRIAAGENTIAVPTRDWRPPYRYELISDGTVQRQGPWVELRRAPAQTSSPVYEVLARTDPRGSAWINGEAAHVYQTGVFFDSVDFSPGRNRLHLRSRGPDGTAIYAVDVEYSPAMPRSPLPLWFDERSASPTQNIEVLPSDRIQVQITGSLGQTAVARVGDLKLAMVRTDRADASLYRVEIPARRLPLNRELKIRIELSSEGGKTLQHELPATLMVRAGTDEFPLLRTQGKRCPLSYSLGRVRLGGPFRAEYGEGVHLQASGKFGRYYRIELSPNHTGYMHERYVEALPAGQARPGFHIASLHASPRDSVDVVSIPWSEPVPYQVTADPEGKRLRVTLYGAESTSTWIQQRSGMRYVERMSWEQLDSQTYQVTIHLKTALIWGYRLAPEGRSLVLRLPYPPAAALTDSTLEGLRIAIEAGHGGSNTGAVGLSGLFEKDVNLDTALRLGALCSDRGAQVIQLRTQDEGVPYMSRIDSLENSGADLVVSIHANSAGGGFLRASGTSTYYHNPMWAPFAERVYARMLELDYPEFGVVGSFNYRNIRLSSRPSILVEQAFMSHAQDEERLADPAHRQLIAEKILAGILDYLGDLRTSEMDLGPLPHPEEEEDMTSSTGS